MHNVASLVDDVAVAAVINVVLFAVVVILVIIVVVASLSCHHHGCCHCHNHCSFSPVHEWYSCDSATYGHGQCVTLRLTML